MIRVLIADDDADQRLLTSIALREHGRFEVVGEASDGREAVELTGRYRPDLLVLDVSMPGMTGLQALPQIRREAPECRVVVYSGYPRAQLERAALDGGAVGYLEKALTLRPLGDELIALGSFLDIVSDAIAEARTLLGPDPVSASRARRFVGAALEQWGCDRLLDDVELMVSELVANAIVHASSGCEVAVLLTDGVIRVEVQDSSCAAPIPRFVDPGAMSGRGLVLVQRLSKAWGVRSVDSGKIVWFEVAAPTPER